MFASYLFLLLLIAFGSIRCDDIIDYNAFRIDLSALTLNRDILYTIIPALARTKNATFPNFNESGSFGSHLYINNVKISYYQINEERFDMTRFEYNYPIYAIKGNFEAILFQITFDYKVTWLGIPFLSGLGSGTVTNVRNEVLVLWNETDPDVQLPHPWDILNLTLNGYFAPTNWAYTLLHSKFINVFHLIVDDSMFDFAHNLLKTYKVVEDVFPDDIDLVFISNITNFKPTVYGTYFSIGFQTNISVNKYLHKRAYRVMHGFPNAQGNFESCFASQLIPDVYDILAKGGYYNQVVTHDKLGFSSNKISELYEILPWLKGKYNDDEVFTVSCTSSRYEAANDITQYGTIFQLLQMQVPTYCWFYCMGEEIIITDLYMRFFYEMKCKDDAYYGHIGTAELYGFVTSPTLPEAKKQLFRPHLELYAQSFSGKELVSPGIQITPNRKSDLHLDLAYFMDEEICFSYTEIRPIANKK